MRRIAVVVATTTFLLGCSRQAPAPDKAQPATNQFLQTEVAPKDSRQATIGIVNQSLQTEAAPTDTRPATIGFEQDAEVQPAPVKPASPAAPPVATVPVMFLQKMQEAAAFEKQQRFGDAIKSYQDALVLVPKDARATEAMRKADFAQHYAEGQKLMTLRRFLDAAHEFEIALQRDPGNPFATAALKTALDSR
jgi:tetratricopeptide (TPR) repeat protein